MLPVTHLRFGERRGGHSGSAETVVEFLPDSPKRRALPLHGSRAYRARVVAGRTVSLLHAKEESDRATYKSPSVHSAQVLGVRKMRLSLEEALSQCAYQIKSLWHSQLW